MTQLTRSAHKDLQRLLEPLRSRAKEIIGRLNKEPALGKRLRGKLEGKHSARLGRSHRIIYTSADDKTIVIAIKPRKDSYR